MSFSPLCYYALVSVKKDEAKSYHINIMSSEQLSPTPDRTAMQCLWHENGPIIKELQSTFEPLTTLLSSRITKNAKNFDVVSNWYSGQPEDKITFDLPYDGNIAKDPFRMLPPDFFADEDPSKLPRLPYRRNQLVADYMSRFEKPEDRSYSFAIHTAEHFQRVLPSRLKALAGLAIDPSKWAQYRQAALDQRTSYYHLAHLSEHRDYNLRGLLGERNEKTYLLEAAGTGRFETYMYTSTAALRYRDLVVAMPTGYIVTPVGEYGPDFAQQLLETTRYTSEFAQTSLHSLASEIGSAHTDVVRRHTARGSAKNEERTPAEALIATVQEGSLSIMQTLVLLTAEKVEGYENPIELTRAIVDAGLIEQFTRVIPMGVLGPFIFGGAYFPKILQNVNGKLKLNPEVIAIIKEAKQVQTEQAIAEWAIYRAQLAEGVESSAPDTTGLICPGAMPHGPITQMATAMVVALEAIDR